MGKKKKKKRADEMTTEEIIERVFPKKIVKELRKIVEEKHRDTPPKK